MLCCVLLGVIYGFLISPIKKGISFGNNNGNNYNEILYLIFDYPHKHYTFKHFEI